MNEIGKHKTNVFDGDHFTYVTYHQTHVVKFNSKVIILNSNGWNTKTTKLRMNQTSNQYNLGFSVYQDRRQWYVTWKGVTLHFSDNMELIR